MKTHEMKILVGLSLLGVLAGTSARADEAVTMTQPKRDRGEVMLAVKVGGLFPQAFSNLNSSYLVDVEVGYALPVLKHRLALTLEAGFTAPETNGQQSDPRLDAAGGSYTWNLQQRELLFGLNLIYRHPLGANGRFIPYIGVGPRLVLLESRVQGQAGGAPILLSSETSTKAGLGVPLGFGVKVGPGHFFLEAALLISNVDHTTTGDLAVGVSSISAALGYRLML